MILQKCLTLCSLLLLMSELQIHEKGVHAGISQVFHVLQYIPCKAGL